MSRGVGPKAGTYSVYCHTHTASGRRYVGVTSGSVAERWRQHVARSRRRSASVFQLAVREHGPDAFTCETLETVLGTLAQAQDAERKWVSQLRTDVDGFNLDGGGLERNSHPETRAKCAARRKDYINRSKGYTSGVKFNDRIAGLARLPGSRIRPAPKNFRTHGPQQRDAMRGVLADVGIAQACVVWVIDAAARARMASMPFDKWLAGYDGDVQLIDGHLRAEEIRDQGLPCVVLDVDDREAAELLATFDPIGALAGFDRERYVSLAADFNSTNAAVQSLVSDLARMETKRREEVQRQETPPLSEPPAERDPDPPPANVPESKYREQYGVIVVCADASHQESVYNDLLGQGLTCKVVVT